MEKKANAAIGRQLPQNVEAEQSLLGCIMLDSNVALDTISSLCADDFYIGAHKNIFEAMQQIVKSNRPIDLITLLDELDNLHVLGECGGVQYVTQVMKSVPSTANYRHYFDIVKRDSVLRQVIRAANNIVEESYRVEGHEQALAYAEKQIYDISTQTETSSLVHMKDSFADVLVKLSTIQTDRNAYRGVMTGFTELDRLTNGLQKSDLILIAARPGVGKTSFSTNIVEHVAVHGNGVCAVFSLEMPKSQLALRMICSLANVSMSQAMKGELTQKDWESIWQANELITAAKIYVDDSSLTTPRQMLSKCRRLKARQGLDLVMIDYIQLMQGDSRRYDNRQQEISDISRSLKILAKELNVPVIALSQLSRQAEQSTYPMLSHLRESGAIEQDADIVMFIHRPDKVEANFDKVERGEVQRDVAEIIFAKHRNGALGKISLKWIGEMTKFVNINTDDADLEKRYHLTAPLSEISQPPIEPLDLEHTDAVDKKQKNKTATKKIKSVQADNAFHQFEERITESNDLDDSFVGTDDPVL